MLPDLCYNNNAIMQLTLHGPSALASHLDQIYCNEVVWRGISAELFPDLCSANDHPSRRLLDERPPVGEVFGT